MCEWEGWRGEQGHARPRKPRTADWKRARAGAVGSALEKLFQGRGIGPGLGGLAQSQAPRADWARAGWNASALWEFSRGREGFSIYPRPTYAAIGYYTARPNTPFLAIATHERMDGLAHLKVLTDGTSDRNKDS